MYKDVVFHGKDLDETIKAFADIVVRNSLLRRAEVSKESSQKTAKENIYNKILQIVRYPKECKNYYKKGVFFRSCYIIRITRDSAFYNDLKDIEIPLSFGDYEIDTLNLTVAKC